MQANYVVSFYSSGNPGFDFSDRFFLYIEGDDPLLSAKVQRRTKIDRRRNQTAGLYKETRFFKTYKIHLAAEASSFFTA